jgi:hypothetical protein
MYPMQLSPMFHYLKATGMVPICEPKTSKNFPQTLPEILFKSTIPLFWPEKAVEYFVSGNSILFFFISPP